MKIEVEQKFAVDDLAAVRQRLAAVGAQWRRRSAQRDVYYAHPVRDFAATDEALRIRQSDAGARLTYKGPRLDATTKTRRELEIPLADDRAAAAMAEILAALGFVPAGDVAKTRDEAAVPWQGRTVVAALDEVAGLGTFVELELVVPDDEVPAAQAAVSSLAAELGLTAAQRRSYLELLLNRGK